MSRPSSFIWKREAIFKMGDQAFPDFPAVSDVARVVEEAGGPGFLDGFATKTTRRFVEDLMQGGDLVKLRRDLYLNRFKRPIPNPNAAASVMYAGSIVSLHTVLGEHGVLNNPSRVVFGIIPTGGDGWAGRASEFKADVAGYRFVTMSGALVAKGAEEDRIDPTASYLKATPERALADWLYLVARREGSNLKPFVEGQGTFHEPPPLDTDLEALDMDRLHRCCEALNVSESLADYLARKAEHDDDPGVQGMSGRFW